MGLVFIGRIVGELVATFGWNVCSLAFGFEIQGIDLTRYGAWGAALLR